MRWSNDAVANDKVTCDEDTYKPKTISPIKNVYFHSQSQESIIQ